MRWLWPRQRRPPGAEVQQVRVDADKAVADAAQQAPKVAEVTRAARVLARQTDRFARDIDRALRLRGIT